MTIKMKRQFMGNNDSSNNNYDHDHRYGTVFAILKLSDGDGR